MLYGEKKDIRDSFSVVKARQGENPDTLDIKETNIDSVKFDGKTLVVLCGNNTRDPRRASFYASCCFGWLSEKANKKDITAYSIYYPFDQPLRTNFEIDTRFDYNALSRALFEQVLTKDGKSQNADEIAKNLKDVVFFGHSIGGFVMNELMYGLGKMMHTRKYSDEDIKKVYQNIVFVAYSPYSLVAAPINHIYVTPMYDSMGSTKLVYDRMVKVGNMNSSNPNFDIHNICRFRSASYFNFLKLYETAMRNQDTVYFSDHNALISTPNLLFDDGIKEDHNFAGIINYPEKHPRKTKAGEITTKFLNQVFDYAFTTSREKFSTASLFEKITKNKKLSSETDEEEQLKHKEI